MLGLPANTKGRTARPASRALLVLAAVAAVALSLLWRTGPPVGTGSPAVELAAEKVQTLSTVFLGIFLEALPFLLLGILVSALIHQFVSDELLARLVPRHPVPAAVVGGLLGMVFPVCECGVIPVSRRLLSKGAPLPLAVSFMLAGPVVNPIVLASTWIAFSGNPAIVFGRFGLVLAVAVAVGLVFGHHRQPAELLTPLACPAEACCDHDHHSGGPATAGAFLRVATDEFFEMGKYMVMGALIAASLQTLLPRATLLAVGQDPVLSVLAAMGLAVLLSICSTVDAFVALSLAGTFSAGALLAFLTFGPMVDIKSVLMFTTTFRRRAILLLVLLSAQLIFLVTAFVNLNLRIGL